MTNANYLRVMVLEESVEVTIWHKLEILAKIIFDPIMFQILERDDPKDLLRDFSPADNMRNPDYKLISNTDENLPLTIQKNII